jgi:hypothetical protein
VSALRPRALGALALADLRERMRRPAFMVTLGVALWAASVFTPAGDAPYVTLQIGGHRGLYNSAWIGAASAIMTSVFFSFAGFYLVRNAIEFDRRSGVGAILATTPMRRVEYTLGKWLGNLGVLVAMTAVMVVGAAAMQLARGEDRRLEPLVLAAPFLAIVVPAMAVASGMAVLFETVPLLRGGFGNVVFFFVWIFSIALPGDHVGVGNRWLDPLGVSSLMAQMRHATAAAFPDVLNHPGVESIGFNFKTGGWHLTTFRWAGPSWDGALLVPRVMWLAAGAALAMLAAIPFDRFEGASAAGRPPKARKGASIESVPGVPTNGGVAAIAVRAAPPAHVELPVARPGRALPGLVVAELRLLLLGLPPIWYVVPLGLVIVSAFVPIEAAMKVAAVAWGWPVLRWSALGSRDRVCGTSALLLSSPRPVARQLPAAWIAGAMVALAMGGGILARSLVSGHFDVAAGVLAGAAFVPALALALGTWTGSSRMFEVLYLVLWYGGPLNGIPFLDYTGGAGVRVAAGFAVAAVGLMAIAGVGLARKFAE